MRYSLPFLVSLVTSIALTGCTVGPDYSGRPAVAADAIARGTFVRAQDTMLMASPGLARWWETLADPTLNVLVDDALAHSPSIEEATARIREAQAELKQQRASQLPSVSANATYLHAALPGVGIGQSSSADTAASGGSNTLDFYNLGLNASWEPDLFGGGRRGVEQSRATIDARGADLADTQVTLSAQVAQAYVNLRDVQARIRLNAASTTLQRRQVELAQVRYAGGTVSLLAVERLRNQLESTQANAIPLGTQRDEYLNQLAVLTGRTPGALDATLAPVVAVPLPPAQVAIGNPAALIAHRPDIRSAERQLAASTAAIGVYKAKELPGIRFLGILGLGGTSPGDVFDTGNLTTLLAPSLSWSFLDFGKNRAATRASEARRDGADAKYRRTVLAALQDAENALSGFGNTRAQLRQLVLAEATAMRSERLNAQRVQAGTSSVIDQLDIERQRLAATIAVQQSRAQLSLSYIAVNKALGLGWSEPAGAAR
ncbi:NodT family efflux transporter outer membrane factor (OMF) lipoprotein [Sphingomonas sp. PP-CE-3A-406]|uniref:efflux transporter outer membrane subunit n=1 Tax=Sphingomonas sp. Leaf242 TaxID=1736304 RepID=UPI000713267E|nr:efflux transporter outer membrane subunit [Sphingomonas sp. Leaf242]KQO12092.1 RND transporter [Sphingomonas sp. Leaf242]RMB54646.1 NodT family efflux transporter outer membrane factor (OMF) lipoprotein [Sphingomonas sp. PP-CE-3A-406]